MTAGRTITLDPQVRQQVHQALVQAYPYEGCGLIGGRQDAGGWQVHVCAMATNASERAARQFEIDPLWYTRTERQWNGQGTQVLGVVHSHPDCPPIPSETDRVYATNWPGFLWWIVRVDDRHVRDQRVWVLTPEERFTEVALSV